PCRRRTGLPPPASPLGGSVLGVGGAGAVVEPRLDARDAHLALVGRPALALTDLAQPREQVALDGGELLRRDLAELEPHLSRQQLLAQNAVIVELAVHGGDDLVQHELDAPDQQRIEDDHRAAIPRPATVAMAAASSSGATGFGMCIAKPAASARARSSTSA